MANFGDLTEFLDDSDFSFTHNGKEIKFTAPAEKVMKFTIEWQKHNRAEQERLNKARELVAQGKPATDAGEPDRWGEHKAVAALLGGSFDAKTFRYKECVLADLQEAGVPTNAINRIQTGIVLKYVHGDLAAEHYMLTGDMNEAIMRWSGKAAPKKEHLASQATQKEAGETSTDD